MRPDQDYEDRSRPFATADRGAAAWMIYIPAAKRPLWILPGAKAVVLDAGWPLVEAFFSAAGSAGSGVGFVPLGAAERDALRTDTGCVFFDDYGVLKRALAETTAAVLRKLEAEIRKTIDIP